MQYFIFGTLLILGAVGCGLSLYMTHKRNRIVVKVIDSSLDMEKDEESIKRIRIVHSLEFETCDETIKFETDLIPVREIKNAELYMYYNKEEGVVYQPDFSTYVSLVLAFAISGICCFVLCFLRDFSLLQNLSIENLFVVFLVIVAVIAFSHMDVLFRPSIIRTKGNYEGVIRSEDGTVEEEVYSLWYGEHRQYTKRIKGMFVRNKAEKPVVLFYNTKTGVARRSHELVISVGVGIAALATIAGLLLL